MVAQMVPHRLIASRERGDGLLCHRQGTELRSLAAGVAEEPQRERDGTPPSSGGGAGGESDATASALLRAEMLALGLERSATNAQSSRRLRLLRELQASVGEVEAEI